MKFDVDRPGKYMFSDRQILSETEKQELRHEYRDYLLNKVKNSFSSASLDKAKSLETSTIVMGVIIAIGVLLVIIGAITRNALLCLGTFAVLFIIGGLMTLIKGGGEKHADQLYNRLSGLIMILVSVLPFLTWYIFMKNDSMMNKVFIIVGEITGMLAILLLVRIICALTGGIRVYTRAVQATCIGYARYVDYERHENNFHRQSNFYTSRANPYVSPVFEYSFEGQDYVSTYDDFRADADSDVPLGPTLIKISPKHPNGVYNSKPANLGIYVFFAIILLLVAGGMIYLATSGITSRFKKTADGSYVLTETTASESTAESKKILTDDMIKFNDTWYIEKVTIKSIEYYTDGDIYSFNEEEFRKAKDSESGIYKEGQVLYALYTIDEESLDTGLTYKVVINLIDPEEYDYQGSHGAWTK